MATKSFWDHPIERIEEVLSLKKQIHSLQEKLSKLVGLDDDHASPAAVAKPAARGGRRTVSPAARARMSAAQRARRARSSGATTAPAASAARSKPAKKASKSGRSFSPEARAKMALAARRRWAAFRQNKKG